MFKFKVGDEVIVSVGRDKGQKGKIEKVLENESKVVVNNVNVYKRHRKVTRNQPAGIFEVSRPISVSKVAVICPKCSKPTRIGFEIKGTTKERVCKKCNKLIGK